MFSMSIKEYSTLSALPPVASVESQTSWTGMHGKASLDQSLTFIRSAATHFQTITIRAVTGISIMDYSSGYERLARLMCSHTDSEKLFGLLNGRGLRILCWTFWPVAKPASSPVIRFSQLLRIYKHAAVLSGWP